MARTAKQEAWYWCSLYIRLRDAIEYQNKYPEVDLGWVKCCTCTRIIHIKKNADAGHFIPKGRGGASGVYYDERNLNTQCKSCNGFFQGRYHEYELFMLDKYGQDVIDLLKYLDIHQSYKGKIVGIGLMYKEMYTALKVGKA
jgi:hypothetical protein